MFTSKCQILYTCKNFLKNVLTYYFRCDNFKLQEGYKKGVNEMRLKEKYSSILAVVLFYAIIVIGIILLNARLG